MPARPTALVTGRPGGSARPSPRSLGAAGHPVAVDYASSQTAAEAVAEGIRTAGGAARAYRADVTDVTDEQDTARMAEEVRRDLGPVGVLVLHATGPQPQVPVVDLGWPDVQAQLDFFVESPVLLLGAVLPHMRAAGYGRIVHIGSDAVQELPAGSTAYATAKTAQLALARMWAAELGPSGLVRRTKNTRSCTSEDAAFVNGAWLTVNGGTVRG